jgi:Fic family protein
MEVDELFKGTPFLMERGTGDQILQASKKIHEEVRLLRSNGKLDDKTLAALRKEWGFQQVHESAAIEGNELTLNETEMAILQGITISGKPPKHSREVQNLHGALQYLEELTQAELPITEHEIRQIHALVLGSEDSEGGKYRTVEVRITNSPHRPPSPVAVAGEMANFSGWMSRATLPIPLLAAVSHAWLVHIHPFSDGNGRTARAVTNLLLMRHGFPVVVIRRKDRQRYYECLRAADDGDIGSMVELVIERVKHSLQHIDRIRSATTGINNAILAVQEAERRRFRIWQDATNLFLSQLAEALSQCTASVGFSMEFLRYDPAGEEDYRAIEARDTSANCWLAKVSIRKGGQIRSLLLWLGHASAEITHSCHLPPAIPALKLSERNPHGFPKWLEPSDGFPTSIREIVFHGETFYVKRSGGATKAESLLALANQLAGEIFVGWFS